MKLHVLLAVILGVRLRTCALEGRDDESEQTHHLTRRQTSEHLGPIPYASRDQYAPLPYQGTQDDRENTAVGIDNNNNDAIAASRDYQNNYPSYSQGQSFEDWAASSDTERASYIPQTGDNSPTSFGGQQLGSDLPSGGQRAYYQYQSPTSTGRNGPTRTHLAIDPRYTFSQPVSTSVRGQGRTYSYPFAGGRAGVQVRQDGQEERTASPSGAAAAQSAGPGGSEAEDDEEPLVQVFPSEPPVISPQLSRQQHQELLRQRHLERERLLQQRQQQQQRPQGGYVQPTQQPPSGQQRPIYTGSQQLGTYGQPVYYTPGQQQQQRQRPPFYTGQVPILGRQQPFQYGGQAQPDFSRGQQPPLYNYGYTQVGEDTAGYDSECPSTGISIQINSIPCDQAVDHYGSFLCYRHEYTSRECCLKCRTLKNPARIGCEYGDHSGRCQQLQSYDCYDLRNRQSCCHSCERMQKPGARAGCEYGDMTPNCERVRQTPGLCYIPENRYLCCETCSTIRLTEDPECPWGDQNADLCQLFDETGNIRINCYAPPIKRICCQACRRLREWIPVDEPGCEYGDRPVSFNTGTHRNLNCTSFMRYFGYEQCSLNQAVAVNCCYTCHRYSQG